MPTSFSSISSTAVLVGAFTLPALAFAAPPEGADSDAEPDASGGASLDLSTDKSEARGSAGARGKDRGDVPWIKRWAPEDRMTELGVYGGVFFPNKQHELFDPDVNLTDQGFQRLRNVAPDIGIRGGYYPIKWVGVEGEAGVMPSSTRSGESAVMFTVRGQVVAQLALWSITPFVTLGFGGLGVGSEDPPTGLGTDLDPALHVGGGLKFYINRWVMLRLDVRDVISHERGADDTFRASNLEALLGLSVTLGRKRENAKPGDRDGDGILDDADECPRRPENFNQVEDEDGCPEKDTDGDGILDKEDACIDEAETFNSYKDEDGCPEKDTDGDGIYDDTDQCVEQAETVNEYKDEDGCPEKDTDGDGLLDDLDKCIEEPETVNEFEDEDGCPDDLPEEIKAFTGVIEGIYFDSGKASIKKKSLKKLEEALDVLTKFPSTRIKITGHTDSQGDHDYNVGLSERRAEAVKQWFVDKGIDATRLESAGKGPDEPIANNKTSKGRAKNRRIEFKLVH